MEGSQFDLPTLSRQQVQEFGRRLNRALRTHIDAYADSADVQFARDVARMNERNVEIFFASLREDRAPTQEELAELAHAARRRLHQGVPLEAIYQSYRIGMRVLWECLLEVASPRDLGRLGARALEFADIVSSAAADGYLEERERGASSQQEASRLFLTRLLSNGLPDNEATIAQARRFGLDLAREHVVAALRTRNGSWDSQVGRDLEFAEAQNRIRQHLPQAAVLVMQSGPVAVVPADSVGGMTAELLRALPRNVTGGAYAIGVGTPKTGAQGIFASYAEAQRSLALGAILQPTELVYLYDELKLFDLFSAGDQVDAFVNEVLGPVLRHDRRDGRLIATLNVLFGAALNRKVAARRLGVHPNTLTYRIRRLEELLGGSLLSGEFCFRVQLALKLAPLASRPAPASPE